jgi:hypothetical protein
MHDGALKFGGSGQVFFGHIDGSENPIGAPTTKSQLLQNPGPASPIEASAVSAGGALLEQLNVSPTTHPSAERRPMVRRIREQ